MEIENPVVGGPIALSQPDQVSAGPWCPAEHEVPVKTGQAGAHDLAGDKTATGPPEFLR